MFCVGHWFCVHLYVGLSQTYLNFKYSLFSGVPFWLLNNEKVSPENTQSKRLYPTRLYRTSAIIEPKTEPHSQKNQQCRLPLRCSLWTNSKLLIMLLDEWTLAKLPAITWLVSTQAWTAVCSQSCSTGSLSIKSAVIRTSLRHITVAPRSTVILSSSIRKT